MCGVVAIHSRAGGIPPDVVERCTRTLRHRGPDGNGAYRSPDGRTVLGHSRLAVVDLSNGAQPIANEDGSVVAVVNGELYDDATLRSRLEAGGHRFRTRSDSEVLVHLYEEHGLAMTEWLRGEFAFVVWDVRLRRLVAGRDRFGIKPLVYADQPGSLRIASEAKALFASGVRAEWDHEVLAHALTHQYLPTDATLFRGVKLVPPGHLLVAEPDCPMRLLRYWDLDLPRETAPMTVGDEVAAVREGLEDAVRLRLRGDVPVAFHLSGGLDSASILALAARQTSAPLDAFAVSFGRAPFDELENAQHVASVIGARLHSVRVGPSEILDALPDAVFHGEGLCINGQLPAKLCLARAIRAAGYKVVLSGEGADELFAGYAHLGRDYAASLTLQSPDERARLDKLDPAQIGVMLPRADAASLPILRDALGFEPTFFTAKAAVGRALTDLLADDHSPVQVQDRAWGNLLASIDLKGQLEGRSRLAQSTYLWTKLALAGYILRTLGDGSEMAASVEGRTPFLDHVLFETARRVPDSLKIVGDVQKHVLREAVRDLLPAAVTERRKHPFLAPAITGAPVREVRERILDVVNGGALESLPLLSSRKVRHFAENALSEGVPDPMFNDAVLMPILSACALQERFHMETGS